MIEQLSTACVKLSIELTVLADRDGCGLITLHDRLRRRADRKTQRTKLGLLAASGFNCGNASFDCGLAFDTDHGRSL